MFIRLSHRRALSECSSNIPWRRDQDVLSLKMPFYSDFQISGRVRRKFIHRIDRAVPGKARRHLASEFERDIHVLHTRYYPSGQMYILSVMELYRKAKMYRQARSAFETAILHGVEPTPSMLNELLLCSKPSEQKKIVADYPQVELDSHCYCTLISRSADLAEGIRYLSVMAQRRIPPTVIHFNSFLSSQKYKGRKTMTSIFKLMMKYGVEPDLKSFTYLVYSCNSYSEMAELSNEVCTRNIEWFNAVLRRLSHIEPESLDAAFAELTATTVPNSSSYVLYLNGKASSVVLSDLPLVTGMFAVAINKYRKNPFLYEAMLSVFVKLGCKKEAKRLRSKMQLAGLQPSAKFMQRYDKLMSS
eukprot:TRINITY_DN20260_c0_g1_i1.p1 TRINITY_DN20260_c0_g1~~TRINITY_DN20260_c0_g1_i1.p1  ORF type:complete len:359 (+),score=34.15 TRINITY_DN20260_c0_g1_i1:107-1183(+)